MIEKYLKKKQRAAERKLKNAVKRKVFGKTSRRKPRKSSKKTLKVIFWIFASLYVAGLFIGEPEDSGEQKASETTAAATEAAPSSTTDTTRQPQEEPEGSTEQALVSILNSEVVPVPISDTAEVTKFFIDQNDVVSAYVAVDLKEDPQDFVGVMSSGRDIFRRNMCSTELGQVLDDKTDAFKFKFYQKSTGDYLVAVVFVKSCSEYL